MGKLKALLIFYFILLVAWVLLVEDWRAVRDVAPVVVRRPFPRERPFNFPRGYIGTHQRLAGMFAESTSMFAGGNVPVLALPPFAMAAGGGSPEFLSLLTESAFYYLYNDRRVRVVRRDYEAGGRSRIRAYHILIGRVSTIGNHVRVTVRIQDVHSGEILDVFAEDIYRGDIARFF